MPVSIIIPTYNGVHKLPDTLNALNDQSFKDFELIIVVDGSTDGTIEVLNQFKSKFGNFQVLIEKNGGRAAARNKGVSAANRDIIVFMDDDIEAGKNCIETHYLFLKNNPSSIHFSIPRLNYEKVKHDEFLRYRYFTETKNIYRIPREIFKVDLNNYLFSTSNMAIYKESFLSIGKFEEKFTDSEDFDFSVKALEKGYQIYCNPNLVSYHNDFANLPKYIARQQQYYESKKQLLKLHPHYTKLLPFQFKWMKPSKPDHLKKIIFYQKKIWDNFFSGKLFQLLPENVKYSFFDMYIYSNSILPVKRSL